MKKLLLFMFIPLVSLSQSFDDIMSIDSKEQFVRIMVENGYERSFKSENQLSYALDPVYSDEGERSPLFINYWQTDDGIAVLLQIQLENLIGFEVDDNVYDKIFDVAKSKCEFNSLTKNPFTENEESDEMVQYKCEWIENNMTWDRFIGFEKKDGTGFIVYIVNGFNLPTLSDS